MSTVPSGGSCAPIPSFEAVTEEHFATGEVWGQIADRMIVSDREAGRLIVPPALSLLADSSGRCCHPCRAVSRFKGAALVRSVWHPCVRVGTMVGPTTGRSA
jgi:hypothetical protein